mmetsp:Transcript_38356/g.84200  ORF Transcript_38356/g.84200 Transcript_38356/m.84200 type:complete len:98 (-) Transcript_38356:1287-1580(-)
MPYQHGIRGMRDEKSAPFVGVSFRQEPQSKRTQSINNSIEGEQYIDMYHRYSPTRVRAPGRRGNDSTGSSVKMDVYPGNRATGVVELCGGENQSMQS